MSSKPQGHNKKKERTGKRSSKKPAVMQHNYKVGETVYKIHSGGIIHKGELVGFARSAFTVIGVSADRVHITWAKGLSPEWVHYTELSRDDDFRPSEQLTNYHSHKG